MTCYQYLRRLWAQLEDGPAIAGAGPQRLRSAFLADVEALAAGLGSLGVRRGSVVAVALPTCAQACTAFYAINKLGAIANIVHPQTAPQALAALLRQTGSCAAFVTQALGEALTGLPEGGILPLIVCDGANAAASGGSESQKLRYEDCLEPWRGSPSPTAADAQATAVFLHGGGTTGESRTVMLSNQNLNAIAEKLEALDRPALIAGAFALTALPIFHAFGLAVALHYPLTHGYTCLLMPRFSAQQAVAWLRAYPVAFLVGVPALFQKLVETPAFPGAHLRTLRLVFCGGDALPAALEQTFHAVLRSSGAQGRLYSGYGLTEVSSVCTVNAPGSAREGAVGKPLQGVTVRILDDAGRPLPYGAVGEIAISGETVMQGYFCGDPAKKDDGIVQDAQGRRWVHSGDLGYLDADGFLFFTGRKKRVILISGYTVYPAEIEAVAQRLPFIREACAVPAAADGKPCIRLYASLSSAMALAQARAALAAQCRALLPRYSCPQQIVLLDRLPRTELGKIDYRALSQESFSI